MTGKASGHDGKPLFLGNANHPKATCEGARSTATSSQPRAPSPLLYDAANKMKTLNYNPVTGEKFASDRRMRLELMMGATKSSVNPRIESGRCRDLPAGERRYCIDSDD